MSGSHNEDKKEKKLTSLKAREDPPRGAQGGIDTVVDEGTIHRALTFGIPAMDRGKAHSMVAQSIEAQPY